MDDGYEKRKITVTREVEVLVPVTAEAWELYDQPGVDRAAKELTGTLMKALAASSANEAARIMLSKMDSIDGYGASDTEPRYQATAVLRKVFGESFSL